MISEQTYSKILAKNKTLREEVLYLRAELANIKKLIFGSKTERHIAPIDGQGSLFADEELPQEEAWNENEVQEKEEDGRKPKDKKTSKPRANTFPSNLKRVEEILLVDGLPSDAIQIGSDVTEILCYKPGSLYIRKIIRPRWASKGEDKIYQANIPERLVPKGKLDESVIAQLIIEKIFLHMPIYRFAKKMRMQIGSDLVSIPTLQNGFHRAAEALTPLYNLLREDILQGDYIQVDESTIKVLNDKGKKKNSKGYMWVFCNPSDGAVMFHYSPTRGGEAPLPLLCDFKGYLQTDAYSVYDNYDAKEGITLLHCMAHARRYFFNAKNSDERLANHFLEEVRKLYTIERKAKEGKFSHDERLQLRQKEAVPILSGLKVWLADNLYVHTPKNPMAKAIAYSCKRWDKLCIYASDGRLEIDNNLIENKIRPLALGRKNYLFAHNENTAQNLAMLYSLIGTCEACGINPHKYITWVLKKIVHNKIDQNAIDWLPHRIDPDQLE